MIQTNRAQDDTAGESAAPAADSATRIRNRNRILDATSELLSGGEPLARLSINRIAKAAGVSRATFYLHFTSKRDLLAKLAQRETLPLVEMAGPALSHELVTRENLMQVALTAIAVYRGNRGVLSGVLELAEYDDDTRDAWRETIFGIAKLFEHPIQKLRPGLSETEVIHLSRMIVWSCERFLHQEVSDESPEQDDVKVWTLVEMAWKLMND